MRQDYDELLRLMEEIRGLSFCLQASGERVRTEIRHLEDVAASLEETGGLKTVFDAKARELSGKIAKLKTLMDL